MAKKKTPIDEAAQEGQSSGNGDGRVHITEDVRKAILFVIDKMEKVKMENEAIGDDVNGIAAKMGCKPAQVKGIIKLVVKEREKGGVVTEEEQRLEWTREVLDQMDMDASEGSSD